MILEINKQDVEILLGWSYIVERDSELSPEDVSLIKRMCAEYSITLPDWVCDY